MLSCGCVSNQEQTSGCCASAIALALARVRRRRDKAVIVITTQQIAPIRKPWRSVARGGGRPAIDQCACGCLERPEDVSALMAFLCGVDVACVTGANLAVNAGVHVH